MKEQAHFDRRGATYDCDGMHHHIVSLLIREVEIKPGFSVLDIATGTGLVALRVAEQVGSTGRVVGVDTSNGMLSEAHRKAAEAGLYNVNFEQADAEHLGFLHESFDFIFCSSALVLMSSIPLALRHWRDFLKPGGILAFDTPAKPFGISQRVVEVAARHGVHLAYSDIADTPAKCHALLEGAGFEVLDIRTEVVNSLPIVLGEAVKFWDEHIDHPALRSIREATPAARAAMRSDFIHSIKAIAVRGYVPNDMALNFSFGRKGM